MTENRQKELRKFKKWLKRQQRKLKKYFKRWYPWDYKFILEPLKMMLSSMKEYYENDVNVIAMDSEGNPNRLETLKEVLELIKIAEDFDWIKYMEDGHSVDDAATKEIELFSNAFYTIGKYILWWWD